MSMARMLRRDAAWHDMYADKDYKDVMVARPYNFTQVDLMEEFIAEWALDEEEYWDMDEYDDMVTLKLLLAETLDEEADPADYELSSFKLYVPPRNNTGW